MLDPNTFWPLAPKRFTWGQIWELISDIPFHCASSAFLRIEAIFLSLDARPAKAMPCTLNQKWQNVCTSCTYDIIWPWKCWSKIMKFALESVLMRAYPPPRFGVSSSSGSRDSRGGIICPPSRARKSQTLSSAHVNKRNTMLSKWMSLVYWVKSYHRKTFFAKMVIFRLLPSGGQTVDLRWNLRHR